MKEFFSKLLDKAELFLLLLGCVLVSASAINGFPPLNIHIMNPVWQLIVAALGLSLVVIALIRSRGKSMHSGGSSPREYGVTIEYMAVDRVSRRLTVEGSVKRRPPDDHICLIIFEQLTQQYYHKGKVLMHFEKDSWKAAIQLDQFQSEELAVIVAWEGPNSIPLFLEHQGWIKRTGIHRGIEHLPPDLIILCRKEIPNTASGLISLRP